MWGNTDNIYEIDASSIDEIARNIDSESNNTDVTTDSIHKFLEDYTKWLIGNVRYERRGKELVKTIDEYKSKQIITKFLTQYNNLITKIRKGSKNDLLINVIKKLKPDGAEERLILPTYVAMRESIIKYKINNNEYNNIVPK